MQVMPISDASSRGQELRYVTAHFRDLQGLRMVPFWAALLVLAALANAGSFSRGHLAWAVLAAGALQFGWLYISGRWYAQRYGVVKEPEPPVPSEFISIMHREDEPSRPPNRYYGYYSGKWATLILMWAMILLPNIFIGHGRPGNFALMIAVFQIFPRCLYPITNNWLILLRRILASAALIAIIGIYINYRFAQIGLWAYMATLLSVLLLLDLYDHWLLNHLLSGGSMGVSDEQSR
jgi:hypothetical protein